MDHNRTMLFIVLVDVEEVEIFWLRHVQLDRAALPGPVQGIVDVKVDLGAVKGAVAFI